VFAAEPLAGASEAADDLIRREQDAVLVADALDLGPVGFRRNHQAASALHGWFAFRALKDDVRSRAVAIASDIAFGITTSQELANRDLLLLEIRNIMAARPTLRWLDIYAEGPNWLIPVASSRETLPPRSPGLVAQAVAEGRTVAAAGTGGDQEAWIAAAPIRFGDTPAGVVLLAISLEGANRLAISLSQQLLFVLVVPA
jgi:hypothetical protein